jgi:hypothetical protein
VVSPIELPLHSIFTFLYEFPELDLHFLIFCVSGK